MSLNLWCFLWELNETGDLLKEVWLLTYSSNGAYYSNGGYVEVITTILSSLIIALLSLRCGLLLFLCFSFIF
jgi:hypothetical protein